MKNVIRAFAIQASSIVLYEVYTKLLFKRRHVNNVTSIVDSTKICSFSCVC